MNQSKLIELATKDAALENKIQKEFFNKYQPKHECQHVDSGACDKCKYPMRAKSCL